MAGKAKEDLTREWLIANDIKVYVNGIDSSTNGYKVPLKDDVVEVYHLTKWYGWQKLTPTPNTKEHPKGKKKLCTYMMIGFSTGEPRHRRTKPIPYHRFLYAWFTGVAHAGMDIKHEDGDGNHNYFPNLREDTHENNLKERDGAKNQYWSENE